MPKHSLALNFLGDSGTLQASWPPPLLHRVEGAGLGSQMRTQTCKDQTTATPVLILAIYLDHKLTEHFWPSHPTKAHLSTKDEERKAWQQGLWMKAKGQKSRAEYVLENSSNPS